MTCMLKKMLCASRCAEMLDPTATKFELPSGTLYSDYYEPVEWSEPPVAIIQGTNAALVGQADGNIIVAFRGTLSYGGNFENVFLSIMDWLEDANVQLIPQAGVQGKMHAGFLNAVQTIYSGIINEIEKLGFDKPVYITGHSKGAAMAVVFAALWHADNHPAPKGLNVFAAPRSGDKEFIAKFPYTIVPFQYIYDVVPYLPPFGPITNDIIDLVERLCDNTNKDSLIAKLQKDYEYGVYQTIQLIKENEQIHEISGNNIFDEVIDVVEMAWHDITNASEIADQHSLDKGKGGYYGADYETVSVPASEDFG